jgi:hypothetical protein
LTLVVACLAVFAFIAACFALKIVSVARRVMAAAHRGMTAMRDPTLNDGAKEQVARQAAVVLFGGFLSLTLRSLFAVSASAAVVYAADLMDLVPASAAIARLASWDFILATTVAVTAGYIIVVRAFAQADPMA